MTKLLIAISVLLFVGSSFANAEQVYYCASELATGIVKDEKSGEFITNTFKEQYERLEEIVEELSEDSKDIDESIKLFREGITKYKECEKKLNEAQKEVMLLTKEIEEQYEK